MNNRIQELKRSLSYRPSDDSADLPSRAVFEPEFNEFKQLVATASESGEYMESEERLIARLQKMLDDGRFH